MAPALDRGSPATPMIIKLAQLLGAPAGKQPPKEFRIFAFGTTETTHGPYVFDQDSAKEVLADRQRRGVDTPLDYEHASVEVPPPPTGAPAAGWLDLELRDDGLWAVNVRWTPRAAEYLRNSEYRYFSPALRLDPKTRRVKSLINVALTNDPATHHLEALVAAKNDPTDNPGPAGEGEVKMKTLLAHLGLKDTSTEAEALAVLTDRDAKRTDLEQALVTLTGAKSVSEAKGQLAALKAKADAHDAAVEQLEKLKASAQEQEVIALVDGGVREGKVPPAMKPFWLEQGKKDVTALKSFLAAAPKLVTTTEHKPGADDGAEVLMLTAEDKLVAKQLGLSEKDFLEAKQKRAAK